MKAATRSLKTEITFTNRLMKQLSKALSLPSHCYKCMNVETRFVNSALQMIYMNIPFSRMSLLCCVIMIQRLNLIYILGCIMAASLLNFPAPFALPLVMHPQSCRTSLP